MPINLLLQLCANTFGTLQSDRASDNSPGRASLNQWVIPTGLRMPQNGWHWVLRDGYCCKHRVLVPSFQPSLLSLSYNIRIRSIKPIFTQIAARHSQNDRQTAET